MLHRALHGAVFPRTVRHIGTNPLLCLAVAAVAPAAPPSAPPAPAQLAVAIGLATAVAGWLGFARLAGMRFGALVGLSLVGKLAIFRRAGMPGNRLGARTLAWPAPPSAPRRPPPRAPAGGRLAPSVLARFTFARVAFARVAILGLVGVAAF